MASLIEAQTFYNAVPSVAEYGGHHYHNWEILPEDLPQGDHTEYVTPRFMKKFWNEQHEGLPAGYRHMYIDELLLNEHNLKGAVSSYLGDWDIVAVINGWTDGPGYGNSVVKDGGDRSVGWVLLVNDDYPVWTKINDAPPKP